MCEEIDFSSYLGQAIENFACNTILTGFGKEQLKRVHPIYF